MFQIMLAVVISAFIIFVCYALCRMSSIADKKGEELFKKNLKERKKNNKNL